MVHFNGEKYIVLCPSVFVTVDSKINPLAFESKFTTTDKLGFDIKISHKKNKIVHRACSGYDFAFYKLLVTFLNYSIPALL